MLKGECVLLVGTQKWREDWRCATTRCGGLWMTPIGTSVMQLLCVDIYITHQIVSTNVLNTNFLIANINFLLPHAGVIPLTTAFFGRGNATILVRDFGCIGYENSLSECLPRNYSISSVYRNYYGNIVPNRY